MWPEPSNDIRTILKPCDFESVKGLSIDTIGVVDRKRAIIIAEQAEPEFGAARRIDYIGLIVPIVLQSQFVAESTPFHRHTPHSMAARVSACDKLLDTRQEVGGRDYKSEFPKDF